MVDNHRVTWSYETYTFSEFFKEYLKMCRSIEESNNIYDVHNRINVFISEYLYAVPKKDVQMQITSDLMDIKMDMDSNEELTHYLKLPSMSNKQEVEYLRIFFKYFLELLESLSFFMKNLSSTFLPHTAVQKKFLRYYNNEFFFQKLTEHKNEVLSKLSSFKITKFSNSVVSFLLYYQSYNLFVTVRDNDFINKCLSITVTKLLSDEVLYSISQSPNIPRRELEFLKITSKQVSSTLLLCNTAMNNSFSKYGILPKVYTEVLGDTTLI